MVLFRSLLLDLANPSTNLLLGNRLTAFSSKAPTNHFVYKLDPSYSSLRGNAPIVSLDLDAMALPRDGDLNALMQDIPGRVL